MKLQRLMIRGFTRFTDPIEIDFSSLPADALIAIVGANGEGKSTILDAGPAALYRTFPSRGDKPLMDYATAKDSRIELEFAHDHMEYRAIISVDAVARKTDAVLGVRKKDGTFKPVNDGKVSTFDEAVANRFPPLQTLLASVFAAQNRAGSFLTMDKGGRKELFAALLGLEHYEAMAQRSRARSSEVAVSEGEARAQVAILEPRLATAAALELNLTNARTERETGQSLQTASREALGRLQTALDAAKASLAQATEERRASDLVASKLEEATKAVVDSKARNETFKAQHHQTLDAIQTKHTQSRAHLSADLARVRAADLEGISARAVTAMKDRHAAAVADKTARIQNNSSLLARADEIRGAVERLREVEAELHTVVAEQGSRQMEVALLEQRIAEWRGSLASATRDVTDLRTAEKTFALMATVPCEGKSPYDGCHLLMNARQAEARIAELTDAPARVTVLTAELASHQQRLAAQRDRFNAVAAEMRTLEASIATYRSTAALLPTLESAETRITDLRTDIATLDANLATDLATQDALLIQGRIQQQRDDEVLTTKITQVDDDCSMELRAANEAHDKQWRLYVESTLTLERHRDDLAERHQLVAGVDARWREANVVVGQAESDLHTEQGRLYNHEKAIALLDARIQTCESQLAALEHDQAAITALKDRLIGLQRDRADYDVLAKCFGKDGLPILEIDAAGPAVSDICNDLLRSCFGTGRFVVELVTQQAKTDKKGMKEVFDLKVYDSERGSEARDLTDLSGGEQVIVDEALKSAIALFVNQRSGQRILTCWRDETTGALDAENAVRYVAMLRRLQARGGFASVLFVTHNPAAAALADVRLVVADGKVALA